MSMKSRLAPLPSVTSAYCWAPLGSFFVQFFGNFQKLVPRPALFLDFLPVDARFLENPFVTAPAPKRLVERQSVLFAVDLHRFERAGQEIVFNFLRQKRVDFDGETGVDILSANRPEIKIGRIAGVEGDVEFFRTFRPG